MRKENLAHDKNEVIQKLQDAVEQELSAGQNAIVERQALPKSEATVYAIVTSTRAYNYSNEDNGNDNAVKRCSEIENGNEMPSKRSKWV